MVGDKGKYLVNGENKVFDTLKDIHEKGGLIEDAPEKFNGLSKEDVYKALNMDEKGVAHIKSPIEEIKINRDNVKHLVEEKEKAINFFILFLFFYFTSV